MASKDPLDIIVEAVKGSPFARNIRFDVRLDGVGSTDKDDTTSSSPDKPCPTGMNTRDFLVQQWKLATQQCVDSSQQTKTHTNYSSCGIVMSAWFDTLWTMHTEPTRHYHSPVHLEEMCHYFQIFRSLQDQLGDVFPADAMINPEDVSAVLLAIFFHDAVYDTKSSTNEEDSASLFESFADEAEIDHQRKQQIVAFILATKNHQVAQGVSLSTLSLFLDLDMAVLGKEETAYMQYAALIRKEFSVVPRDVYCEKRAEILETFLRQPRIYGTSVMWKAFEDRARANVRKEIESLRAGVIPSTDDGE